MSGGQNGLPRLRSWGESRPGRSAGARTRGLHPREAALALTTAVRDAAGGRLEDDATVMCLDWHGPHETQRHVSSEADTRQASAAREKRP